MCLRGGVTRSSVLLMPLPLLLLSVAQAADELGIPTRTLQWRIANGKVEAERVGHAYLLTRVEVDRLKTEVAA